MGRTKRDNDEDEAHDEEERTGKSPAEASGEEDEVDEEVDEITEGGKPSKQGQGREQSLQEFLADQFGADAPGPDDYRRDDSVDSAKPGEEGEDAVSNLPSLGWIKANFKTKSAAIRHLLSQGHSVNDISRLLGVKYQHVRNVKVTQLKRGPNEDWNLDRRSLSEKITKETGMK